MTTFANREDWLKWRKDKIGSSDAAIIMGESEWGTPLSLFNQKRDPNFLEDDSNSFIKNAGNEAEIRVRKLVEHILEDQFPPAVIASAMNAKLTASLDGKSVKNQRHFLECKLLGNGGKNAKPEDQLWSNAKHKQEVPLYYWIQMQHQLMVGGGEVCTFAAYRYDVDDKFLKADMNQAMLAIVHVKPDIEFQKKLLKAELDFLDRLETGKAPDPCDRDYVKLKGMVAMVKKYQRLKAKAKDLKDQADELETELKIAAKASGHPRVLIQGLKLQNVDKIGNIENKDVFAAYDQLIATMALELSACYDELETDAEDRLEVEKPDPESFRKPSSSYWKIG